MDVKPWEPVRGGWKGFDLWRWSLYPEDCEAILLSDADASLHITLANNQRIIVRALSKHRKAARAARKAELEPWVALGKDAADGLIEELRVKGRCDGDPSFRPSRRAKEASQ